MEAWTTSEIAALAEALVATPNAFYARRVLQRLERAEVSISRATFLLRYPVTAGPSRGRASLTADVNGATYYLSRKTGPRRKTPDDAVLDATV